MRQQHPVFDNNIEINSVVWRYFDFPKFTSFLQKRALYFSRANLLGDPLEGSFTKAREIERKSLLQNPPKGKTREQLINIFKHNTNIFSKMLNCIYINCWHLDDHESMAMWRGYGGGPYGIAIQSTFGVLDDVIPTEFELAGRNEQIYIGRVKYMDYSSEFENVPEGNNVYGPFLCKSLAYRNEKEVRAVFSDLSAMITDKNSIGFFIEVDLNKLINNIIVSPLAQEWFKDIIDDLCKKYGFKFNIVHSRISGPPIY